MKITTYEGLARGLDGAVTIAAALPGQAFRAVKVFGPQVLGDDMSKSYYYQVPQLYKMPTHLSGLAQPPKSGAIKALPFIALGIVGIVAYSLWKK